VGGQQGKPVIHEAEIEGRRLAFRGANGGLAV
jgi:hypothetical protein